MAFGEVQKHQFFSMKDDRICPVRFFTLTQSTWLLFKSVRKKYKRLWPPNIQDQLDFSLKVACIDKVEGKKIDWCPIVKGAIEGCSRNLQIIHAWWFAQRLIERNKESFIEKFYIFMRIPQLLWVGKGAGRCCTSILLKKGETHSKSNFFFLKTGLLDRLCADF